MATIRNQTDDTLERISDCLRQFEVEHADADIVLYRQNPASVRIRVVSSHFQSLGRTEQFDSVWTLLEELDDEDLGQVSMLLTLVPDELSTSFANLEFDAPVPSRL